MTLRELRTYVRRALISSGDDAVYDADIMIRDVLGISGTKLLSSLSDEVDSGKVVPLLDIMINKRNAHVPLAYITGETVFFGLPLLCGPGCLIPRQDTEFVCEKALEYLPDSAARAADICTGSGCITAALLSRREKLSVKAYDISEDALRFARENAVRLGFGERAVFTRSDIFSPGFMSGDEYFDMIVSNPPYIASDVCKTLSPEVKHEPVLALDGGEDGLAFYKRLIDLLPAHLKRSGTAVFEIGYDQRDGIISLCSGRGFNCEVFSDYGGNPRAAVVTFR